MTLKDLAHNELGAINGMMFNPFFDWCRSKDPACSSGDILKAYHSVLVEMSGFVADQIKD